MTDAQTPATPAAPAWDVTQLSDFIARVDGAGALRYRG